MIRLGTVLFLSLPLFLLCSSCKDNEEEKKATMRISFSHKVDGELLQEDQMIYTNAAGNRYEVIEVMYFLSDLKLHRNDGTTVAPASWNDIHYVDTHIPSTFLWTVPGEIPPGTYDSITFTFGIAKEKNKSFLFVNPPEVNMAWPDVLGGGYHYLMLNGWWRDLVGVRQSFNFHLGIGQIYQNNSGQVQDIIGFVHNAFTLTPTGPSFTIGSGQTLETELTMHLESWFSTPHVYDHNYWGGAIMQNQAAMQVGCENGRDAFTVEYHQAE